MSMIVSGGGRMRKRERMRRRKDLLETKHSEKVNISLTFILAKMNEEDENDDGDSKAENPMVPLH